MRPDWLVAEPEAYEEYDLGRIKTGKEADVFLVERSAPGGRSCLLAHKRYRPRSVSHKGELEDLGFDRAGSFVHDRAYRDGRTLAKSRDRRAAAKGTAWGRAVLRQDWAAHEFEALERLAGAGVSVPWPVEQTADGVLMQYLGDRTTAAPRLVHAGLDRPGLERAAALLVDELHGMVGAGIVHADLSPFNLLWWDDRLWVIDLPQSADLAGGGQVLDLLHRDLANVGAWFTRRGVAFDADLVFDGLLGAVFGYA